MKSNKTGFNSVDEYIATFPKDVQKTLEVLRATIKAARQTPSAGIDHQNREIEGG
jgi:hypothetical protein